MGSNGIVSSLILFLPTLVLPRSGSCGRQQGSCPLSPVPRAPVCAIIDANTILPRTAAVNVRHGSAARTGGKNLQWCSAAPTARTSIGENLHAVRRLPSDLRLVRSLQSLASAKLVRFPEALTTSKEC